MESASNDKLEGDLMARGNGAARGQDPEAPRAYVGVGFIGLDPIGELQRLIDQGFGGQLYAALPVAGDARVRLRGDFGFLIYGHERLDYCFTLPVGCRIGLDLTTTNSIVFGGLGPEIVFGSDRLQPYLNGSAGFAYFATTSHLNGDGGGEDFGNTTNHDDGVFAWRVGGGARLRMRGGPKPLFLDFGVERHDNGVAEFLTEGDIVDNPDGSVTLFPNRSEANLLTFRIGVTFGLPRGSD